MSEQAKAAEKHRRADLETHEPARRWPDWKAAILAGLAGGLAMLMLEMFLVPLVLNGSPWGPPRMMAAIVMGKDVLPPPASFSPGVLAVAMLVHFALSVIYALVLMFLIDRVGTGLAVLIGAAFGFILYIINFYGFTAAFPWFENARNWVTIVAHLAYGATAAAAYKMLRSYWATRGSAHV